MKTASPRPAERAPPPAVPEWVMWRIAYNMACELERAHRDADGWATNIGKVNDPCYGLLKAHTLYEMLRELRPDSFENSEMEKNYKAAFRVARDQEITVRFHGLTHKAALALKAEAAKRIGWG